jgi:hypothetical protein
MSFVYRCNTARFRQGFSARPYPVHRHSADDRRALQRSQELVYCQT